MKILFVSNLYPPHYLGGYEKLCKQIAGLLEDRGHEISVLTSTFKHTSSCDHDDKGIYRELKLLIKDENNIYHQEAFSPMELSDIASKSISTYKKVIAREKPDLVFVWNLYFFHPALTAVIDKSNVKVVYFLTDNWLKVQAEQRFPVYRSTFTKIKEKIFGSDPLDEITSPMKGSAIFSSRFISDLYRDSNLKFSRDRIIYNGVNVEPYIDLKRSTYDLREGGKLLFAGRVVEVKGVHVLLDAFSAIVKQEKYSNVTLDIVGDLSDEAYVQRINAQIDTLGIRDKVRFVSPVPEDQLPELFNQYDIFVFSSIYEPFSLTLILALGAGLPVIGSDAGGNVEILCDGDNALLYPKDSPDLLATALGRMLDDRELREKLSSKGRLDAQEYKIDKLISHIDGFLQAETEPSLPVGITESFNSYCNMCGSHTTFISYEPVETECKRNTYTCVVCGSCARNRHIAKVILDHFPTEPASMSIKDFALNSKIEILHTCASGAFHDILKNMPTYRTSEYYDDIPSGDLVNGIECQDLQKTSYGDNTFDLIITEDIFEHVIDPVVACKELRRILKHGGEHISTIAVYWDMPKSVTRATIDDNGINHIEEPVYHGDPNRSEGALVFTDFGADIVERFLSHTGPTDVLWSHKKFFDEYTYAIFNNMVFVSRKDGE